MRTGGFGTTVTAVSVLSAGFVSRPPSPVTVAVFVCRPTSVARAVTVIVLDWLGSRVPRLHVMSDGVSVHVGEPGLTVRYVIPAGAGSTSCTFVAVSGPLFVTVIVYRTVPFSGVGDVAFFTMTRSISRGVKSTRASSESVSVFPLVSVPVTVTTFMCAVPAVPVRVFGNVQVRARARRQDERDGEAARRVAARHVREVAEPVVDRPS